MASLDKNQKKFQTLLLNTPENEKIELKAEQLQRYYPDSKSLGRFGLKTAEDVIAFLNSPAGVTVKEMIAEELALIAAIENERRIQMQDDELRRRRLLAFLLSSLLASRDSHAKHHHIAAQKQMGKHLQTLEGKDESKANYEQATMDIIAGYDAEIKTLRHELRVLELEEQDLTQQLTQLGDEFQFMLERHRDYQNAIAEIAELLPQEDEFILLQPHPAPEHEARRQSIRDSILSHLAHIAERIESHSSQIAQQIAENQAAEERQQMNPLQALIMQRDIFIEIIACSRRERQYYNEQGEAVYSSDHAKYALRPEHKLVVHEGEIYLLNQADDIHQLGSEAKAQAAADFQQNQGEYLSVKAAISNNQQREIEAHSTLVESLRQKREITQNAIKATQEQIQEVVTARDNSAAQLQSPQLVMQLTPAMTFTKNIGQEASPKPRPSSSLTKEKLQLIKYIHYLKELPEGKITPRQLQQQLGKISPQAQQVIHEELYGIPPNAPIPHTLMISLLKNLERFGVDATKANVTNYEGPLERIQDEKYHAPSPNPFDMTLKRK